MQQSDFSFVFEDISEHGQGRIIPRRGGAEHKFGLSVGDTTLSLGGPSQFAALAADLIDLAAAIHVADRLSGKRFERTITIHVDLPLRHAKLFQSRAIRQQISEVLFSYSADWWDFNFRSRSSKRSSELQMNMPLQNTTAQDDTEVALWSGGLDSLAGLNHRLSAYPTRRFLLVGTGSNNRALGVQHDIAAKLRALVPYRTGLKQVPIHPANSHFGMKNPSPRTRGFVFVLMGTAVALLEGHKELYVYENGVGAINLPYRASEVGLDHTRSVNPISLDRTSRLLSQLLEEEFVIRNPFLGHTKAQMCEGFSVGDLAQLVSHTRSCDRMRHAWPDHCGSCSSCLLRCQALAAAGIADPTNYATSFRTESQPSDVLHFAAMQSQAVKLTRSLDADNPWEALSIRYPELSTIADVMAGQNNISRESAAEKLVKLYRTYVDEWRRVEDGLYSQLTTGGVAWPMVTQEGGRSIALWTN